MADGPPAKKLPGVSAPAGQTDLVADWGDAGLEEATTRPDPDPARQYLTLALLGLVAIVILTLLALVATRRISVADAVQLGGIVLTPLFTLLGLAVAYYFRQGGN